MLDPFLFALWECELSSELSFPLPLLQTEAQDKKDSLQTDRSILMPSVPTKLSYTTLFSSKPLLCFKKFPQLFHSREKPKPNHKFIQFYSSFFCVE